jgi:DNA-binding NtrC family response regulator
MMKGQFRILLVDDEQVILNVMRQTLEAAGYICVLASSGAIALQRLQEESADLVIADIRMPGMSGVQLADAVAMKQPDSLLIFITGYVEYSALSQAIQQRPLGFLERPFLPDQLLALVDRAYRKLCDRRNTLVEGQLLEQLVAEKTKGLEFRTERSEAEKDLLNGIITNSNSGLMAVDASGNHRICRDDRYLWYFTEDTPMRWSITVDSPDRSTRIVSRRCLAGSYSPLDRG